MAETRTPTEVDLRCPESAEVQSEAGAGSFYRRTISDKRMSYSRGGKNRDNYCYVRQKNPAV